MSTTRTRKEDMWARSSTSNHQRNTSSSPPKSTPEASPSKSESNSSSPKSQGSSNSTKDSFTPTSAGSYQDLETHSPDAEDAEDEIPRMPNVSREPGYESGFEDSIGDSSILTNEDHQEHAAALTRALSRISMHGDTTPAALRGGSVSRR